MNFFDYPAYGSQAEDSTDAGIHPPQHFAHAVRAPLQAQAAAHMYHPVQPPMSCDVKPRLTKEQHDILEAHFQKQHKPSTNTKKGFAESLNVSLDKVNNWFQNRRAKSKQDAKKAAGQAAAYQNHAQNFGSDSEPSPFQPSQQYSTMMHHMSSEEHLPNGLGISQVPLQNQAHGLPFSNDMSTSDQFQNFSWPQGMTEDMFDSPLEFNRRTLTQEQFDALSRSGGMMDGPGQFDSFKTGFSGDANALQQMFPDFDFKQDFGLPFSMVAPSLSSNDSVAPSVASGQAMPEFSSTNVGRQHQNMSSAASDWTDSRSSSLASAPRASMGAPMTQGQQQPQTTTSHWEPGQSVPVDVNAMKGEFQQAAAQASQMRASMEQQAFEQPLAWPSDEAYERRDSAASMLAQSMGNVGIHTPQTNSGVFKSPAPPASIAARRQRPKPANLSLRSQSYAGPVQPSSPGHQQNSMPQGQQIRRVMSTNVINGGVAQGRVMKSVPGSAQRSPLNWTFNDALNSPHLVRAVSQGNLAPPTPMSPSHPTQAQQPGNFSNNPNQVGRQPSINENEEYGFPGMSYQSNSNVPPHVSPPHTPHWFQQTFIPQRVGSTVITENTPPQSAPASQSCFPSNVFAMPQHPQAQASVLGNISKQQYNNSAVPDQQYQMPNVTFAHSEHANVVASGPPPGMPLTFANAVPVMKSDGNVSMSFPPQVQMMQQQQHQQQQNSQVPFAFVNSNGPASNHMLASTKLSTQPPNDFVVHEYSPPDSVKRSATPRKPVESGPKNYTFANAHPSHYEKGKKGDGKESSSSPASSNGTAGTFSTT